MSRKVLFGTTLGASLFFILVGVIFWGGFNTTMEVTNTLDFCISCHEMEDNVFPEYQNNIHYSNRTGVRASCSDCHVPRPWIHKVARKIEASKELYHKLLGTIDTPEKFDAKRLHMARKVWKSMKETDSRECRNCHDFESMKPENQKKISRRQHASAMENGNTCIDCHKGSGHSKAHHSLSKEELLKLSEPTPENIRPIAPQWQAFIDNGKNLVTDKDSKKDKTPRPVTVTPKEETHLEETETVKATSVGTLQKNTSGSSDVDWRAIEGAEFTVFFPGQSSLEWVLTDSDHDGRDAVIEGERCFDCHEEQEADIGDLIVSGGKNEPTPIPGKRGSILVNVKATHDDDNLYMQFQWDDTNHIPVPFADEGKMDTKNPIKLAIMLTTDNEDDPKVEFAERAGCWLSCHHDVNHMPHRPDDSALTGALAQRLDLSGGYTKYLKESRTELEIDGNDERKRGGWDKLKDKTEIQAMLDNGTFMDLLRYKSGTGESEDGYILAERVMSGGQGVDFSGELKDGIWTVEMTRKLTSDKAGDVSMSLDQWYNIGFAIHDDYSNSRFHHVSLGLKLGFDDEDADINAIAK